MVTVSWVGSTGPTVVLAVLLWISPGSPGPVIRATLLITCPIG